MKPVAGNTYEAFCCVCKKAFKLGTMGVKALESHARSAKHLQYVKDKDRTPSVISVFSSQAQAASLPVPSVANANAAQTVSGAVPSSTGTRVDLRTSLGSTPTMKAEVLWTLHTVAQHQSYNSNEGISGLFQCMFPDSNIASTFACSSDKTAYIAKFGLAVYIKDELVEKVNQSPYVLMFDESLSEVRKSKQLNVHIRLKMDSSGPDILDLSSWDIPLPKTSCRI